ncbi:MAG: ABC transporter substrate-binding protein [Deltaproteobacteria bacterium]|jgi:peptide/nickel transport system substrate-binding protein|nr:ABC transporter substrate-binding protein [Deltaproteobacteria bacterium]
MKIINSLLLLALTLAICCLSSAPAAHAASKDSLNMRLLFNASTVSPYLHFNDSDWWWQAGVYEPLVWLNDSNGNFEPMIAKEWSISDDGLTYTFKLRDDVYFHNGEKLTADDVVFSYNLAKEAPTLRTFTKPYESVEAVDPLTVAVHLPEPYYPFLHHSSMIKIVSKKAVEEQGADFGTKVALAGTGPYHMVEYNPAVKVTVKAFDKYYRGKAPIENVNYIVMIDDSSAVIAFENGELDMIQVPSTYWKDIVDGGKFTTKIVPRHELYYMIINLNSPENDNILGNKLVRQAIGYSIDKEAIVDVVREGLAIPYSQFMNPEITAGGPDPTIEYGYDPEKAKALLAEAGYPDGVDVGTFMSFAPAEYVKMAQIIQASCDEVGIRFKIEQMEVAAGLTEMRAGNVSMAFCASTFLLDYDYIGRYFHTSNTATTFVKYEQTDKIDWKKIDGLFDQGTRIKDLAERKKAYSDAEREVMDSGTYFPIMMTSFGMAWNKDLEVDSSDWGAFFMFSPYGWAWK